MAIDDSVPLMFTQPLYGSYLGQPVASPSGQNFQITGPTGYGMPYPIPISIGNNFGYAASAPIAGVPGSPTYLGSSGGTWSINQAPSSMVNAPMQHPYYDTTYGYNWQSPGGYAASAPIPGVGGQYLGSSGDGWSIQPIYNTAAGGSVGGSVGSNLWAGYQPTFTQQQQQVADIPAYPQPGTYQAPVTSGSPGGLGGGPLIGQANYSTNLGQIETVLQPGQTGNVGSTGWGTPLWQAGPAPIQQYNGINPLTGNVMAWNGTTYVDSGVKPTPSVPPPDASNYNTPLQGGVEQSTTTVQVPQEVQTPVGTVPTNMTQLMEVLIRNQRQAPQPQFGEIPGPLQNISPLAGPIYPRDIIAENPLPTGQAAIDAMLGYRTDAGGGMPAASQGLDVPYANPNLTPIQNQRMMNQLINEQQAQQAEKNRPTPLQQYPMQLFQGYATDLAARKAADLNTMTQPDAPAWQNMQYGQGPGFTNAFKRFAFGAAPRGVQQAVQGAYNQMNREGAAGARAAAQHVEQAREAAARDYTELLKDQGGLLGRVAESVYKAQQERDQRLTPYQVQEVADKILDAHPNEGEDQIMALARGEAANRLPPGTLQRFAGTYPDKAAALEKKQLDVQYARDTLQDRERAQRAAAGMKEAKLNQYVANEQAYQTLLKNRIEKSNIANQQARLKLDISQKYDTIKQEQEYAKRQNDIDAQNAGIFNKLRVTHGNNFRAYMELQKVADANIATNPLLAQTPEDKAAAQKVRNEFMERNLGPLNPKTGNPIAFDQAKYFLTKEAPRDLQNILDAQRARALQQRQMMPNPIQEYLLKYQLKGGVQEQAPIKAKGPITDISVQHYNPGKGWRPSIPKGLIEADEFLSRNSTFAAPQNRSDLLSADKLLLDFQKQQEEAKYRSERLMEKEQNYKVVSMKAEEEYRQSAIERAQRAAAAQDAAFVNTMLKSEAARSKIEKREKEIEREAQAMTSLRKFLASPGLDDEPIFDVFGNVLTYVNKKTSDDYMAEMIRAGSKRGRRY